MAGPSARFWPKAVEIRGSRPSLLPWPATESAYWFGSRESYREGGGFSVFSSGSKPTPNICSPSAVDLGANSLALVELVLAFEEAFEIEIPDEDTERIRTAQDAVEYIEKLLQRD